MALLPCSLEPLPPIAPAPSLPPAGIVALGSAVPFVHNPPMVYVPSLIQSFQARPLTQRTGVRRLSPRSARYHTADAGYCPVPDGENERKKQFIINQVSARVSGAILVPTLACCAFGRAWRIRFEDHCFC